VADPLVAVLDGFLEGLGSASPVRQYEAFLALCETREDRAVEAVVGHLPALPDSARPFVARLLGRLATPLALHHLGRLISAGPDLDRRWASAALDAVPIEAKLDVLLALLEDPSGDVKYYAVRALGKSRNEKVVVPLMQAFRTGNAVLRAEVLKTFEWVGHPAALSLVPEALRDPSHEVVVQAVQLLRNIPSPANLSRVCGVASHASPEVRRKVCWALGRLRGRKGERLLADALRRDPEPRVRLQAARSLGAYASKSAASVLVRTAAFDADAPVRKVASFSLVEMPGRAPVSVLLSFQRGGREAEQRIALELLGLRGERRVIPLILGRGVRGSSLAQRVIGVEVLGRLQEPQAVPLLRSSLAAEPPLAYAAAQALCQVAGAARLEILEQALAEARGLDENLLQVFALHLALVVEVRPVPAPLCSAVRSWCESPNDQLRYLALRVLVGTGEAEDLDVLQRMALREPHAESKRLVREVARGVLARRAGAARDLLASGRLGGGPEPWRWLYGLQPPLDEHLLWVKAVLELLAREDARDRVRAQAVLVRWAKRQATLVAQALAAPSLTPRSAILLLGCLARAGRSRSLSEWEEEAVRAMLLNPDSRVRRAALLASRRARPDRLLEPVIRLAEGGGGVAGEALAARQTLLDWLGAGKAS
jgi:HEAT repeat protein